MKWNRQQYLDLMTYHQAPRQMFVELFGPLIGLEEEWRRQGAGEGEVGLTDFCFDYVPVLKVGNCQVFRGYEPQTLEETADYVISTDELGRKVKLMKGTATIPLPMEYPVTDMDSWLKMKPLFAFDEARVNLDQLERAAALQKQGTLIRAEIFGGYDTLRELMGEEMSCLAYYEQPELVADIMATLTDTALRTLERITDRLTVDNLSVHEDMAGKSGPMIGPNLVTKYVRPYYRAAWDLVSSRGCKLFCQDSDGNMNPVIQAFIDCGVNVFYPCEPAAGMDVAELRKKFGRQIAFKGGIDKHVLRGTKEEIRRELEYKMQPLMQEGGMVFGLDHRIPNGTPLENYRYYVRTAREILGLEPTERSEKGWGRMAF